MSDPFNSLGGESPRVNPDGEFVDAVMRAVQERLDSPSVAPTFNADTDLTELEVIPMNAHRSGRTWWLAAAAVVVVVGGLLATIAIRDDEPPTPAAPPPDTSAPTDASSPPGDTPIDMNELLEGFTPLDGGTYSIDPDGDAATSLRVVYDVPAGWTSWFGAVKFSGNSQVMLSVTTMTNLVRDACTDHRQLDPPVGPTVDDLATALTGLHPFEVSVPPREVTVSGFQGTYLELTVPSDVSSTFFSGCADSELRSWAAPLNGGEPFSGYEAEAGMHEEFWILEVDGTRLVIQMNWSEETSADDITEMRAIFDSIQIQP